VKKEKIDPVIVLKVEEKPLYGGKTVRKRKSGRKLMILSED
jgi:hypothetical protein